MTVIQGDSHVWNNFLPRDGGNDVRIFDWDCWRVDVAADDLAYMLALHWYPDRRRRMEQPLLDCYHSALLEGGVKGYDRADTDRRLSVGSSLANNHTHLASNVEYSTSHLAE
jgi:Ecdysteroid kinase-like family